MKKPLIFIAVCWMSPWALAAESPRGEFAPAFQRAFAELRASFLQGRCVPTTDELKARFSGAEHAHKINTLTILTAQAAHIQKGSPSDTVRIYYGMIKHVAQKLGADEFKALAQYLPSFGFDDDRSLGEIEGLRFPRVACAAEHKKLLETPEALRVRLFDEMLQNSRLPAGTHKRIAANLEESRRALLGPLGNDGFFPYGDHVGITTNQGLLWKPRKKSPDPLSHQFPPPQTLSRFKISPPPQFQSQVGGREEWDIAAYQSGKIKFVSEKSNWDRAGKLAREILLRVVPASKSQCLRFVKAALDTIMPRGWREGLALSSAYQFTGLERENPALFKRLKLKRLTPQEVALKPLPIGAIIVYQSGVCGMDIQHGHIEVAVSENPPKACAYGCRNLNDKRPNGQTISSCIRTNGLIGQIAVYLPFPDMPSDVTEKKKI